MDPRAKQDLGSGSRAELGSSPWVHRRASSFSPELALAENWDIYHPLQLVPKAVLVLAFPAHTRGSILLQELQGTGEIKVSGTSRQGSPPDAHKAPAFAPISIPAFTVETLF